MIISNWLETDPPVEDIRFNFDWNDDYGEYTVSILHNLSAQRLAILGNKVYDINMSIMIHIFVKQLTEAHPARAGNIEKEIMRILVSNTGSLGNGIEYSVPKSFRHADEEDSSSVYWHSIANLMLTFTKKIT